MNFTITFLYKQFIKKKKKNLPLEASFNFSQKKIAKTTTKYLQTDVTINVICEFQQSNT